MKIGIFLSAAVVILFVMLLTLNRGTPATAPTGDTSAQMLARQDVPADAPSLFTPTNPQASADAAYARAREFYEGHQQELSEDEVPADVADQWGALFVEAANAGQVSERFLDQASPMTVGASGPYSSVLTTAPRVILTRAQTLYEEGKQERAIELGRSMWALGIRGYTKNLRAHERFLGLFIMEQAVQALGDWLPQDHADREAVTYWSSRIDQMNRPFMKKYELLKTVAPNIGDIIRMANEDQDPTFRLEATLKLGILQFAPKSKANLKLMKATFEKSKKDAHPQIAQAGHVAEAVTVEQVKKMK